MRVNSTIIIEPQYFPPVICITYACIGTHVVIEQYDTYRKMSFRNRCTLSGANGPIHLSVPLAGGRGQRTLMKDVRIDTAEHWQDKHWKTITACYNRSPWFDFFRHTLEDLYSRSFDFLLDWDLACLEWLRATLAWNVEVSTSTVFLPTYQDRSVSDLRNRWLPANINRLNPDVQRYPQVFEERHGFIPNLSVLDRLFCMGDVPMPTSE